MSGNPNSGPSAEKWWGLYEIKVDHGPGYRVYFCEQGDSTILLLVGGDKKSQRQDIKHARLLRRQYVSEQ